MAPSSQLVVGRIARVSTDKLNIRTNPSLSGSILEELHTGDTVTVVGGPVCGDGYRWWKVKYFITGWMADGDTSETYLELVGSSNLQPDFSDAPIAQPSASLKSPLNLDIGDRPLPVLALSWGEIGYDAAHSNSVRGFVLGPGVGIACEGIGFARSSNPTIQAAIDAGDITCAYVGAAGIIVMASTDPVAAAVFATPAIYPFLRNPDKYIGIPFRNEVYKWTMAKQVSCQFADYILDRNQLPGFCQ